MLTIKEINEYHRRVWRERNELFFALLQRPTYRKLIRRISATPPSPPQGDDQTRRDWIARQPSLEGQILRHYERRRRSATASASHPRRKIQNAGVAQRQFIAHFASRPENATKAAKVLWREFERELKTRGLRPEYERGDSYSYDGQRDRLRITRRTFENCVSKFAPRRSKRKS